MVDYPMFFLSLPIWNELDTFLTLRGTQGWYLNYVLPLSPSKSVRVVSGWVTPKILVNSLKESLFET